MSADGTRALVVTTNSDPMKSSANVTSWVTVVDTTLPVLTLPANLDVAATGPSGAAVTWVAGATDLVDGTDPVLCAPSSGSTFPLGTTTVTCHATDTYGNEATGSFNVTVALTRGLLVLDPSAAGALTLTGNAKLSTKEAANGVGLRKDLIEEVEAEEPATEEETSKIKDLIAALGG